MNLTIELLKLGFVGLISGLFAAIIAMHRFKHEKWWEMRVNAYKTVIDSLSDLTAIYEQRNKSWEQNPIEPQNIRNEIRVSFALIRKHKDMGAFLFSDDAEIALKHFIKFETDYNYENISDPSDIYGPFSYSSRNCLDKIVALSKQDLAVTKSWLYSIQTLRRYIGRL